MAPVVRRTSQCSSWEAGLEQRRSQIKGGVDHNTKFLTVVMMIRRKIEPLIVMMGTRITTEARRSKEEAKQKEKGSIVF